MTSGLLPVCYRCARLVEWPYCEAFGDTEIPVEIGSGRNDHTEPVAGDHGLLFKPVEDV